jgi:hypothetical protein
MSDNRDMDPALLGTINVAIGSLIGFGGTWISNRFAHQRETDQWKRQHEAEEQKRLRSSLKSPESICLSGHWVS